MVLGTHYVLGFFLKTQPRLELKCKHRTQLTKPWSCHAQGVWASPRTQGAPSCGSSLLILLRTLAKYQTRLFLHSLPGSLLQATRNVLSISYETELPPESKLSDIIQYMHLTPLTGCSRMRTSCFLQSSSWTWQYKKLLLVTNQPRAHVYHWDLDGPIWQASAKRLRKSHYVYLPLFSSSQGKSLSKNNSC